MHSQQRIEQQMVTASPPDKHTTHHDKYKKQQIFSFISNKNLSNFICIPLCGIFWVGGYIYANQNKISPVEINLARYIGQIFSTFIIIQFRNQDVDYKSPKDFKMLMIRSVISGLNGMAAAFFQMYLPLTVYYTINASITIFTFLLNHFLFGIHITAHQIKAVITAFVGIVLVINGRALYQFINSSYEFTSTFDYNSSTLWVQILMGIVVVVWSCIWAYGIVISGKHHASFHEFVLIHSIVGYFMFSLTELMLAEATPNSLYDLFVRRPEKWISTILYCGIPLTTANYIFSLGMFISANTGVSTMINQINILYVYFISTIRYDEQINLICLLGGILLIGAIYITIFKK